MTVTQASIKEKIAQSLVEPNRVGLRNVAEVAEYLGLSRAKVYLMMDAGELPFVKLGKSRRIRWADVEKLIEQNTHGGAA